MPDTESIIRAQEGSSEQILKYADGGRHESAWQLVRSIVVSAARVDCTVSHWPLLRILLGLGRGVPAVGSVVISVSELVFWGLRRSTCSH